MNAFALCNTSRPLIHGVSCIRSFSLKHINTAFGDGVISTQKMLSIPKSRILLASGIMFLTNIENLFGCTPRLHFCCLALNVCMRSYSSKCCNHGYALSVHTRKCFNPRRSHNCSRIFPNRHHRSNCHWR
jgi:hypothetical protein